MPISCIDILRGRGKNTFSSSARVFIVVINVGGTVILIPRVVDAAAVEAPPTRRLPHVVVGVAEAGVVSVAIMELRNT